MDYLQFKDDGRTLTCRSASSQATPGTNWWWLDVTGEKQRYAAFRTEKTDTPQNLRPRILACYLKLLADRERPATFRIWSRPTPANVTVPADASESVDGR